VQPPEQLQPGGLHDVGRVVGLQTLRPGDVPEQRGQGLDHLVQGAELAGLGSLEATGQPGVPIGGRRRGG